MVAIQQVYKSFKYSIDQKNPVRQDIKALREIRRNKEYYKDTRERRKELSL